MTSAPLPARKRRPRLPGFGYQGLWAYHVTCTTHHRASLLVGDAAARVADQLRMTAARSHFDVLAYCIMPDHVHLLVQGREENSDLVRFVQRFKQETSFHYKRASGSVLWQQSFHDRVLRSSDDVLAVARYIIENPVRSGFVHEPEAWALWGGDLVGRL